MGALRATMSPSSAIMGVFSVAGAEPEGVLAAQGVDAGALTAWFQHGCINDSGWQEARQRGSIRISSDRDGSNGRWGPVTGQHLLAVALPASLDGKRFWYLACARNAAFSDADEIEAMLTLRRLQVSLDHIAERGLGRLLVADGGKLVHADPQTEARLHRVPSRLDDLLSILMPVVKQRWGDDGGDGEHDAIVPLPDGPAWVRFRREAPVPNLPGHLYLEIRPVTAHDPPAVGVLPDDRIAEALAFLTDHFQQTPELKEIAQRVDISPFHFHRLFTTAVTISPKHYLMRMQLMVAKWLLRATHRPIRDVAAETGFASHGHFTATFHRLVGVSPTAYREREGRDG